MNEQVLTLISLILNLALGGGLITVFATLKSVKQKARSEAKEAGADAESKELDNAARVIEMWQKFTQEKSMQDEKEKGVLKTEVEDLKKSVDSLRSEIGKLRRAITAAKACKNSAECPALRNMEDVG